MISAIEVAATSPRHHQESATDPEKAGQHTGREADPDDPERIGAVEGYPRLAAALPSHPHGDGDHDHQKAEQDEKFLAVGMLAEGRAERGADHAKDREQDRHRPAHVIAPRMIDEIGERAQGDRDGTGADGDVGRFYPHHVNQQRHCED
jgi:hypothetical protein